MTLFNSLLEYFLLLFVLGGAAIWLRQRAAIRREEQAVFGRLVTDFALPALIFLSISKEPLATERLLLALLLFCSIAVVAAVAWLAGRYIGLSGPVLGSIVLVSGVGSSSTLGYLLVLQIYGENPSIMSAVVTMGEIGVHLPLFTIGVAIAIHFGRDKADDISLWSAIRPFFTSPIFLAMVLGVIAAAVRLPQDHWAVAIIDDLLGVAADSLLFLVAFTTGLMLKPIPLRSLATLIAIVAGLKLVVEPLIALSVGTILGVGTLERELLVLEAGMPASMVAGVIAMRYGCDGAVASAVVIATYLFCLVTLPVIMLVGFT